MNVIGFVHIKTHKCFCVVAKCPKKKMEGSVSFIVAIFVAVQVDPSLFHEAALHINSSLCVSLSSGFNFKKWRAGGGVHV